MNVIGGGVCMDHLWLQIWVHPRQVVREALLLPDKKREWLLVVLFGLTLGLEQSSMRELGDSIPFSWILLLSVLLSPILGMIYWFVISGIAYWLGRSMDGAATWKDMKTAVAWAGVPFIMKLILWVPELAFFGEELFQSSMPSLGSNPLLFLFFMVMWLVDLVIVIWYVVVLCKSVGEAHSFSAWRGLFSLLLGGLLLTLPFIVLALFFRL